jgi:uncharacterized protein (TIGR02246 family)
MSTADKVLAVEVAAGRRRLYQLSRLRPSEKEDDRTMISLDSTDQLAVLTEALNGWADGIRRHQPERVASHFTPEALFQGFDKKHTIGRPGIVTYYDKQPVGVSPEFQIMEYRQLADDALIAYVDVDFIRPNGVVVPVHLTVVLQNVEGLWLISHYHVSKIDLATTA